MAAPARISWQEKLQGFCAQSNLPQPAFQIVSDRRGGRTAWSSTVTVQGAVFSARFFYDSQYIENAKDDAAEVALNSLISQGVARIPQGGYNFQ